MAAGYLARRQGRHRQAKEAFSESVRLCRGSSDRVLLLANSLVGLGQVERDLKNERLALHYYQEAVEIYRKAPDRLRLAHTVRHVADILREVGSLEQARRHYEEALNIYRDNPETPALALANTIRGFALLRGESGETEPARSLWEEARRLYQSVDVTAGVQESDAQLARLTTK